MVQDLDVGKENWMGIHRRRRNAYKTLLLQIINVLSLFVRRGNLIHFLLEPQTCVKISAICIKKTYLLSKMLSKPCIVFT